MVYLCAVYLRLKQNEEIYNHKQLFRAYKHYLFYVLVVGDHTVNFSTESKTAYVSAHAFLRDTELIGQKTLYTL